MTIFALLIQDFEGLVFKITFYSDVRNLVLIFNYGDITYCP